MTCWVIKLWVQLGGATPAEYSSRHSSGVLQRQTGPGRHSSGRPVQAVTPPVTPAADRSRPSRHRSLQRQTGPGRGEGHRVGGERDAARDGPGAVARRPSRSAAGSVGSRSWRACRAAHIFRACIGSTRVSPSNTVNSTAGYSTPSPDVVVGRVAQQPVQLLGVVGAAVLDVPGGTETELLEADHVQQRRRTDHRRVQVRPLGQRGADQQAAVRAAADRQLRRGRSSRRRSGAAPSAWKSSNTFCLCAPIPARCHCSPSSDPPRRLATA